MAKVVITITDLESGLNVDIKHSNIKDEELTDANVLGQALYEIGSIYQCTGTGHAVEVMSGIKSNYGKH